MASVIARTRIAFVLFIAIQTILWSHSRYAYISNSHYSSSSSISGLLSKRGDRSIDDIELITATTALEECAPLSVPVSDQCAHVRESCPVSNTVLSIPYLQNYFCSTPSVRPFVFAGLLTWLIFLFSTLGISASDFFCPNLATLAARLGLDENVAGVTFLAFGNGSPDLFSTFSAMRAGAGPLAIGELLGAASFIVSVVAGTMCIIRPFTVDPGPFIRDVGFFTAAVALLLYILWDGRLTTAEASVLIALYAVYVVIVVVGSWWERRKLRKKHLESIVRGEYAAEEMPEPYRDDPLASSDYLSIPNVQPRERAHSTPASPHSLGLDIGALQPRSRSRSPSPAPHLTQMPSFSLVGALEFRQVVASLQNQSAGAALSAFESPVSPYVGGHYHIHGNNNYNSQSPLISRQASVRSSYSATGLDTLPLQQRSPSSHPMSLSADPDLMNASTNMSASSSTYNARDVPLISTTPASPGSEISLENGGLSLLSPAGGISSPPIYNSGLHVNSWKSKRQRIVRTFKHTVHVLFPTLHGLRDKSWLGIIASVLAAPAVLALTVTLPVHVTPRGANGGEEKDELGLRIGGNGVGVGGGRPGSGVVTGGSVPEGRLIDFEEEGVERILTAEEDVQLEMHELKFNKWLMATQVVLGPLFCASVLLTATFSGSHELLRLIVFIVTAVVGLATGTLVIFCADRGDNPVAQMARTFMGFFVAVVWIMAIADEVVNVLKTFGFIFGLSDAIIGLTIFAVGNSLADFVANVSVASFAPVMGFSACFGGPMLNILLGVGVSGLVVTSSSGTSGSSLGFSSLVSALRGTSGEPYILDFSTTLAVSTVGLLTLLIATLIVVPLNGYALTRRWGFVLVFSYVVIMIVNIFVEVRR